jgi:hypothetical protein
MCVPDAEREAEALVHRGSRVTLTEVDGQCFAQAEVTAPTPPWDRTTYAILIPIPAAYSDAALDAFYLELPYTFNGESHPRVSGGVVTLNEKQFQLVSWHYPDDRPWKRGVDSLESHITHCGGFFLNRGAVNAFN